MPIEFDLPDRVYSPGDDVLASVAAVGRVVVASDLTASSAIQDVAGDGTVNLGTVREPGVANVTISQDGASGSALLVVIPAGASSLQIIAQPLEPTAEIDPGIVARFVSGLDAAAFERAWNKAGPEWIGNNAVDAGGTATLCIIAAGTAVQPELAIAAEGCYTGLATQAADFVLSYAKALVETSTTLDDVEKGLLVTALAFTSVATAYKLNRVMGTEQREALLAALETAADQKFGDDKNWLAVKSVIDLTKKYLILARLKPTD